MSACATETCCKKVKKSPFVLCILIDSNDFLIQKQKTFDARGNLCYSILAVGKQTLGSSARLPLSSPI